VDFIPSQVGQKPAEIARAALEHARLRYYEVLIVDTAGRLAIDEQMMREITELEEVLQPAETLFVVEAMQGQDAVNVARAFGAALPLTGVVLTKLDGDARGGAALLGRHVTGKPIKFAGVGEKLTGLGAVPSGAHGVADSREWATSCRSSRKRTSRSTSRKPSASRKRSRRAKASTWRTSSSRSSR
jgi:signal recognition particle GTPase